LTKDKRRILVYVQAIPVFVPGSARKFTDLETCEFRMSHSSKAALAYTTVDDSAEIVAAGFSPILREAVARGASSTFSMPLCDDPQKQQSFFPRDANFSSFVIGESPDWVFSGSSLAGVVSVKFGLPLRVRSNQGKLDHGSVILVLDSGDESTNINVRRIDLAFEAPANPEGVLGESSFRRLEEKRSEALDGAPDEIALVISRRLRRITRS